MTDWFSHPVDGEFIAIMLAVVAAFFAGHAAAGPQSAGKRTPCGSVSTSHTPDKSEVFNSQSAAHTVDTVADSQAHHPTATVPIP
jgi:hypothetical protein